MLGDDHGDPEGASALDRITVSRSTSSKPFHRLPEGLLDVDDDERHTLAIQDAVAHDTTAKERSR